MITSEAYRSQSIFGGVDSLAHFRDRNDVDVSGVSIITPETPDISNVFQTNVKQGIQGSGDERGLESLEVALSNAHNQAQNFPRPGAFLSVIFLSDEEDFSHSGNQNIQFVDGLPNTIDDSRLTPVSHYESFLDELTNSTEDQKNLYGEYHWYL